MKTYRPSVIAIFCVWITALVASPAVQARTLHIDEMSSSQYVRAKILAETVVKQDLAQNTLSRVYEAAANSTEPAMSNETRDKLAKGAYMVIASALASEHLFISEREFTKGVGSIFERMASLGLFPQAFTIGYMARYQVGVGGSVGTQFNFYVEQGVLKLSSYSIYGVQAGFAAQTKIQFYAALCFGSCFGGDPNGWYVGTDVSASLGVGLDMFLEFGIDFTEMISATMHGEKYTLRDIWESKAVYAGIGFDVGTGGGWSLDVFHYRQDFEKVLSHPGNNPNNILPRDMNQIQMRRPHE